jgi:Mitochondrial carrier protein
MLDVQGSCTLTGFQRLKKWTACPAGMRGLYKGALPSIMKSAPAAAVTFATYELCIRTLLEARTAAVALPIGGEAGAGRGKR